MAVFQSSMLPLVLGASVLVFVAPKAWAADSLADEERPPTWDMSVDELEAIGLGQYRGDPIPVPAHAPHEASPTEPQFAGQGVIFVNFDGATLSSGYDDSKQNRTQIGNLVGPFAAYGDGAKKDAVMQAVMQDWAEYNVAVTQTRPAQGDYTMCMVGPTNPYGGGVLGIAPLDCNDAQTHNNITYAFHSVNDSFSASTTATTIGQEVAHSYGLEHVDEPGDIMNPYNAGGDPSFRDQCLQVVSNQGIVCGNQHAAQCGTSDQQNSNAELLALFGSAVPDNTAPTVSISAPTDGATFDVGASFEIAVDATDDAGVHQVKLYSNGSHIESDSSEPFGWSVSDIPEGSYEFYVEALDLAGNSAMSNVVTVYVGQADPGGDSGDSDGSGGSGDSGDSGDSDSSDGSSSDGGSGDDGSSDGGSGDGSNDSGGDAGDPGALPPGYGLDGTDATTGCACRADVSVGAQSWWLLLLGIGLVRRRRASL